MLEEVWYGPSKTWLGWHNVCGSLQKVRLDSQRARIETWILKVSLHNSTEWSTFTNWATQTSSWDREPSVDKREDLIDQR